MGTRADRLAISGGSPVRDMLLVFGRPSFGQQEEAAVLEVLRTGWVGTGPTAQRFEEAIRDWLGARYAVAVSSGTAALHLALVLADLPPGAEVVTTPLTFAATTTAIVQAGAVPVFVDVDPLTQNIDPNRVAEAVGPRTGAILPVHFAGYPADLARLRTIADDRAVALIDDAAHCLEGWSRGEKVGTSTDASCFSFHATKNLTCLEGGLLTTARPEWAERAAKLVRHGIDTHAWGRYRDGGFRAELTEPGYKYNLIDVHAAVGLQQLTKLEENAERRREIWSHYSRNLADLPLDPPRLPTDGSVHALHLYTVLLDLPRLSVDRDAVAAALRCEGIGTGIHYRALHLHPYFARRFDYPSEFCPVATSISERTLSLPLSPGMVDTDVDDVIVAMHKVLGYYLR